ncbi:hypothetical protein ABMC88_10175 [Sulfitobacter sp. HNIBRBA2951]|uniref:hypothetical protein n=1 Tax=Sulfitobacter aquimarinus TaxID=3158557 RepID=UPI0032E04B45
MANIPVVEALVIMAWLNQVVIGQGIATAVYAAFSKGQKGQRVVMWLLGGV